MAGREERKTMCGRDDNAVYAVLDNKAPATTDLHNGAFCSIKTSHNLVPSHSLSARLRSDHANGS
jgi:hypothetical protein